MATSSLFKVLELNAEAAKELIEMQEEGFIVNKEPDVKLKVIEDEERINRFLKKYDFESKE